MALTESLKRFRTQMGLTQKQVAEAIGMRESSYQRYEQGRSLPSVAILERIADAFNVSTDYLLGRTDVPNSAVSKITIDSSVIEEIRRAAVAEVDKQIALKFPHARTNFNAAAG